MLPDDVAAEPLPSKYVCSDFFVISSASILTGFCEVVIISVLLKKEIRLRGSDTLGDKHMVWCSGQMCSAWGSAWTPCSSWSSLDCLSVLSPESSMGSIIQKMFAVNSHHHTP